MEARTKIIAAVAVIMMCAAGLVGAGYAYTASTVNDGNSASAEYITLVQGSDGAYNFVNGEKVYWDSADKMVKSNLDPLYGQTAHNANGTGTSAIAVDDMVTQYKLSDLVDTTAIAGLTLVKLGESFTLNPVSNLTDGRPTITIAVTAANFAVPDGGDIWMKVTGGPSVQYFKLTAENTFTKYTDATHEATGNEINVVGGGASAYTALTVEMYYGFLTEGYVGVLSKHTEGAVPGYVPSTDVIQANGTLTFTITVNEWNGLYFTVDTIAVGGEVVDFAASLVAPDGAVITWDSTDDDIATVDADGKVTGHADGSCVITATVTVGLVTVTASVVANVDVA